MCKKKLQNYLLKRYREGIRGYGDTETRGHGDTGIRGHGEDTNKR